MKNAVIAGLVSLSLFPAHAKDWPQWGGDQHRNMYSEEKGLPDRFEPGKLKKGTEEVDLATTKNVKWVAKLGSQSYGNATIADGRVFVGTNNDAPRNNRDEGDRSIMMVSVRRPAASPVASASFCSCVRPSRASEPTSSHVVPGVSAGRPS